SPADNTVAEVNPATGEIIDSFRPIEQGYSVNFGDMDVSAASRNLFIVSSAESTIAEFTPDGAFVRELPLPLPGTGLAGIGLIDGTGEAWVSSTGGVIYRLGGFPAPSCGCEMTGDDPASVDVFDLLAYLDLWFEADAAAERTGDMPASVNVFELLDYLD